MKISPNDIKNFPNDDKDFGEPSKENQSISNQSRDYKNFLDIQLQEQYFRHKNLDMYMKIGWCILLAFYLLIFTIYMFKTLWNNRLIYELSPITLNFLITVGFAKVVGVVWLIVSHLFPSKEDLVKTKK